MATYVEDLIEVLLPYEDGLDRQQVLAKLETLRRDRGHRIRPKFVQTAQKAYESRCVGYESFDKTGWPESEALFFWELLRIVTIPVDNVRPKFYLIVTIGDGGNECRRGRQGNHIARVSH